VGAYGAKSSAGKSYVIFGKTDTSAIDLSKPGDKSKYTIDYLGDKNDTGPQICGVPVDDLSLGVA
jgi:hypothetical protein